MGGAMLKYIHTTWLHAILVLVAVYLDGGIALQLAGVLFKLPTAASSFLCILVILMPILSGTVNQVRMRWGYVIAFAGGLVFDIFYTGIIGIAMIGFPLTFWVAANIQRYFPNTMFWAMATWFLSLCTYLTYDYLAFGLINLANLAPASFVVFHLFPTLLINLILFLLCYQGLDFLYQATRQPDLEHYNVDRRDLNSGLNFKRRSQRY